ncbi:MAG: tryptophan synthase subunit alpha [Negativicutes bacterium]|nr:tryptophan synthase subunit alpha [Negativicutes bacterium]
MSRLTDRLTKLRTEGRKGLIVYLTAGYPSMTATLDAVLAAEAAGADVVEIGIPFSDPIADGPVIQKAAVEALKAGATTIKALALIRQIRLSSAVPLAVMTYVNTIISYGPAEFVRDFKAAGLDGIIVPDLPPEEAGLLQGHCLEAGIDLIQFVAPTSTAERIKAVCRTAGGFIYCISSTGVTGVRAVDYRPIAAAIRTVRENTAVPVAIGFGIGGPEAASEAARHADAVIVGSAIVERLGNGGVGAVRELVLSIRRGLDKGGD